MIKSQSKKHREADQSDKHCLVNGVENLMVDGRGKCRPFGLVKPKAAPTLEVDENGGELRRDAGYSYVISYFDSYHNAESEPSPATEFIKPGSDADYKTTSVGEIDEVTGEFHLNVVKVSGTNLSKIDDYYVGKCIAVLIENDDRPTPYSQWQYRKIEHYYWDGANEVGVFTVARDFVNVDTDPEDQQYEVRLSDMDMEEGEVGGKSAGLRKLVLDPNASTDVSSYRMKVIRIVQGVGKGQSRFIMDATLNALGLVEITVHKPWNKKPKFVDPTLRQTQKKQDSLKTREDAKPKFFNQNWSSSYVISDPLRFNGLCFDGEVEARDKKTGRITISGLGTQQAILAGSVIRFIQGKEGAAKIVISLENANTNIDWAEEDSLIDKRLRITSGPGAGKEYVITASEESGENSVKLTLGVPKSDGDATSISGIPTAKSTYIIYTADAENTSDLLVQGTQSEDVTSVSLAWNQEGLTPDPDRIKWSSDYLGNCTLTIKDSEHSLGNTANWTGKKINIVPLVGTAEPYEPGEAWETNIKQGAKTDEGYRIDVDGYPYWRKADGSGNKKAYKDYSLLNQLWSVELFSSAVDAGQALELDGDDLTRIYINDKDATGIWEYNGTGDEPEEVDGKNNKNAVDGLYTVSFQVASPKGAGKQYKATITRFVHDVGTDSRGDYIEVIGLLPRLYQKPRKEGESPTPGEPQILAPILGSPLNVYGANSRDGFYTGWRALFINTTEIGGNKQKLKVKEARVIASFDATGEIIVDKEIAGVKPGWQCVLYSEYTSFFGSCINSGEQTAYYRKGKADYGIYDDFVPLEPYASSEDDFYNGWTLEVLAKGKLKKDGSTKYSKTPSRYRNKQKRTIIDYFGGSRRAYVHEQYNTAEHWQELEGEPFNPKLNGSEFVWLYDPSTSIEKMFDEESDDSVANEFGIKIKVKGIKMCPLDGVDKIRLYRAPEATGAYRLVVDLENKDQDYVDNTPEEHLSTEINLDHVPPPPCSKVCEYKGRFIMGGAIDNTPAAHLTKGGHMSAFIPDYGDANNPPNPLIEKYLYTDGGAFTGRALKVSPAVGILCNEHVGTVIPQTDETNTEKIKVGLALSDVGNDGIIAWCERRQYSGVFQRSRIIPADSSAKFKLTDWVFLATGCSTNKEDYRHSVLVFNGKTDPDENGKRYDVQQCWPFYSGSHEENDFRYEPMTKQFVWQDSEKVWLPALSGTIYPVPFQIRTALWAIYKKGGKYYVKDTKDEEREIEPTTENGVVFLNASVNQGENFNNLSYHVGGNAKQAVTAQMYTAEGEPLADTPSCDFRLIAVNFALENEDIISSYIGADAEVLTYQVSSPYKPILTIPECIENSHSASTYSDSGEVPVDPPIKATHSYNGNLVWIVVWDKEYTGKQSSEAVTLIARDNAKAVYVTAATDGDVEKVTLDQAFVLNDGFGTDVTAIATWLDHCFVFKQRGVYAFDPDNIQLHIVSNDIGCIATDSMARGRSGLYWLAEGRRFMRGNFVSETSYIGAPIQPWLDGYKDFDGWYVDKEHLTEMLSTYDVEKDEYITFIPAKKGNETRLICLCFCDERQAWYRMDDDNLHSDNKVDCAFRFEGGGAFAGSKGIWINKEKRSGYAAWRWKSIQRDEGNSSYIKHVKRMQIINVVDESIVDNPTATFKFYKEMRTTPEGSYQAKDGHTGRVFYTNKFSQLVHIGLRALMWQFEFYGSSYVKLHDFTVQYRSKGESEVEWGSTPN